MEILIPKATICDPYNSDFAMDFGPGPPISGLISRVCRSGNAPNRNNSTLQEL
jgi:hypothetical protein